MCTENIISNKFNEYKQEDSVSNFSHIPEIYNIII
jgi:hypothetical protein